MCFLPLAKGLDMNHLTEYYTYVLVRQDIKPEHQIVQACHAALHAGFEFENPGSVPSLIVCSVPNQDKLLEAKMHLEDKGIESYVFHEPCWEMGYSALATMPINSPQVRKALAKYPLLKLNPVS